MRTERTGPAYGLRTAADPLMRLYPNPATDHFGLTNSEQVDQLILYNILGRKVKAFQVMEGIRYPVNTLPDGMYFVCLVDRRGQILKTLRLSKQSLRP